MKANLITGATAIAATAAMGSIYSGSALRSILGAGLWIGYNAPALMTRIAWQDFSCVSATVHGCACVSAMLLMTVIAGVARR